MVRLSWIAVVAAVCAGAADHYWNFGYYTDNTLDVLRHIQHSFGW
jgi:hypothetical protein